MVSILCKLGFHEWELIYRTDTAEWRVCKRCDKRKTIIGMHKYKYFNIEDKPPMWRTTKRSG